MPHAHVAPDWLVGITVRYSAARLLRTHAHYPTIALPATYLPNSFPCPQLPTCPPPGWAFGGTYLPRCTTPLTPIFYAAFPRRELTILCDMLFILEPDGLAHGADAVEADVLAIATTCHSPWCHGTPPLPTTPGQLLVYGRFMRVRYPSPARIACHPVALRGRCST